MPVAELLDTQTCAPHSTDYEGSNVLLRNSKYRELIIFKPLPLPEIRFSRLPYRPCVGQRSDIFAKLILVRRANRMVTSNLTHCR